MNKAYIAYFYCACAKRPYFHFRSKIWGHHCVPLPQFPSRCGNFGDLLTFKANRGLLNICMGFRTSWPEMEALGGGNRGRGIAILTFNELIFPCWGSYVCASFGENRSRNATVRVPTDGHTDW